MAHQLGALIGAAAAVYHLDPDNLAATLYGMNTANGVAGRVALVHAVCIATPAACAVSVSMSKAGVDDFLVQTCAAGGVYTHHFPEPVRAEDGVQVTVGAPGGAHVWVVYDLIDQ